MYVCTCTICRFVKLWDVRNLSYQLCCLPFSRPVCAAYFSPVQGSKILVTAMNDCIRYAVYCVCVCVCVCVYVCVCVCVCVS